MGIFNSKNLKKAVNIVVSSSPVINAISQATDIVDKSMDVIDKNLNGGKNWNFSEAPIDEVAKAFMNGVRGKHIVCMMTNISDTAKASIRNNFNLDIDEQILFFNDTSFFGNKNQGIVITNKRLAWIPDNDEGDVYSFAFNDIERVEYREMQIYLWGYGNDEDNVPLPLNHFFSFNGETSAVKTDAQKIAAVLNKMVNVAGHEVETTPLEEIESYLDNNEADKAIQGINEMLASTDFTDEETKSICYYYLGLAYAQKMEEQLDVDIAAGSEQISEEVHRYDDAMNSAFREALVLCKDDEFRCKIYYLNALYCLNQFQGRQMALAAMESPDFEIKQEAKDIYMKITKDLVEDPAFFSKIPYNTRKFIFVLGTEKQLPGCYDKEGNIQFVFTLNDLPTSIQFPVGHPQANTLYIGHPFKPATYLPFENATEQLFMERVHELCYLGQCLGANEIRIKRLRGLDTASSEAKQLDVSGELDVKAVNVGGSFGRNTAVQNSYSSKDGMEMVQTYLPTKQPYCPDDLVWLDSETSWQALVKQRLNGNILSYSLHLSSSESVSMTSSKVQSVKASFEYLVTKVSGTYDAKTDKTFSKTEETEWEIDMQFKPLQDFDDANASNGQAVAQIAQTQNSELSEDELAYKEEVEFCLEDAPEIDAHSRKFLQRKRQKLGISEARAKEIEYMVTASQLSFTDEEKEYMEALDDVIEDGAIPNNVCRLLERERRSLGISEERAKELEDIKCKA